MAGDINRSSSASSASSGGNSRAHPDCINASNPYHECVEYCFQRIAEARDSAASQRPPPPGMSYHIHPDCINASNPYHECVEYCFQRIAEARDRAASQRPPPPAERTMHPDCTDAADPYHECDDICFRRIAEAKYRDENSHPDLQQQNAASDEGDVPPEEPADGSGVQKDSDSGYPHLNERQKKLFELRLKMNETRKANQMAMVAEKNKLEAPPESRGISKQKWLEERKKKIGKLLDANGLDMKKAYMLDTQEMVEAKYKKWEKDPAFFGWDGLAEESIFLTEESVSNSPSSLATEALSTGSSSTTMVSHLFAFETSRHASDGSMAPSLDSAIVVPPRSVMLPSSQPLVIQDSEQITEEVVTVTHDAVLNIPPLEVDWPSFQPIICREVDTMSFVMFEQLRGILEKRPLLSLEMARMDMLACCILSYNGLSKRSLDGLFANCVDRVGAFTL